MSNDDKTILLTFDLEEFDIPLEYGQPVDTATQMAITLEGMERVQHLLDKYNLRCTFFTTAFFADHHPALVKELSNTQEIASHAYHHSVFKTEDLLLSKQRLEAITQKEIKGFRMPRMKPVDNAALIEAGYRYDSSVNPTWIPSRYNNLRKPRTLFTSSGLLHIPASVSPHLRIPLFWLFFKNAPLWLIKKISAQTLQHDGYLNLYFHPWEFADISTFHLPGWMKKPCGDILTKKLDDYIDFLTHEAGFTDMRNFIAVHAANNEI